MKASFLASAFALGVVLVGAACASPVAEDESSTSSEQAASDKSCRWKCGHCPKGAVCKMACTPSGHCPTTCTQTMLCIQGYTFDAQTCQCVPSAVAGEACGPTQCAVGQVCCNSSCGICTDPGAVCTQQACASTTL